MSNPYADLVETYREMSDEELVALWISGNLTEDAMSVALEEFHRRGVQPPPETVPESPDHDSAKTENTVSFVTVARSLIPSDLHLLRARLEGDGIPSFVVDDNLTQMNALWSMAIGGARLLVTQEHAEEAGQIIDLVKSGKLALSDNNGET